MGRPRREHPPVRLGHVDVDGGGSSRRAAALGRQFTAPEVQAGRARELADTGAQGKVPDGRVVAPDCPQLVRHELVPEGPDLLLPRSQSLAHPPLQGRGPNNLGAGVGAKHPSHLQAQCLHAVIPRESKGLQYGSPLLLSQLQQVQLPNHAWVAFRQKGANGVEALANNVGENLLADVAQNVNLPRLQAFSDHLVHIPAAKEGQCPGPGSLQRAQRFCLLLATRLFVRARLAPLRHLGSRLPQMLCVVKHQHHEEHHQPQGDGD
mmetsp:Transcript_81366/g.264084  ORF Transcript_81366/g.264084 Transcript_81366/m.264084 type:complete len:264 (+) Transcript_81366:470-1261(+)